MPISQITPTTIDLEVVDAVKVVIAGLVEYTFYVNAQKMDKQYYTITFSDNDELIRYIKMYNSYLFNRI